MPSIEISQLYNHKRFPASGLYALYFLLYVPVGITLFLLRVIIGFQIFIFACILPDSPVTEQILSRLLCITLGITILVENPEDREDLDVFMSNYVSHLDHLVAHSVTGCVTPGVSKLNPILSLAFGIRSFGSSTENFDAFKKNVSAYISQKELSMYFQPECKITNGKALLKFKTWPFSLCESVQPICIKVCRPLLNISVTSLDSTYWSDTFFFMFSPYTNYKLKFLPVVLKSNLTDNGFADQVRQNIATALKIEATNYSANDLQDWEKRYILEQQRNRMVQRPVNVTSITQNPELQRMARQVKEVLPLVPYNTIYRDLIKTRSVDITITNILEGHVSYTPESQSSQSSSRTSPSSSSSSSSLNTGSSCLVHKGSSQDLFNTAASAFGKSVHERTLSFQERKRQLIENARKRYIEKHGLNIVALNNC